MKLRVLSLCLAVVAATAQAGAGDGRIRVQLMSRYAVTLSSEIPAVDAITAQPTRQSHKSLSFRPVFTFHSTVFRSRP